MVGNADMSHHDIIVTHRIHVCYIWSHGSHQYAPNVSIYTSTMDPMGYVGGVQVMVEFLCRMVLPISAEAEVLLLKSVKGGGSGAPLDLGREVLGVLKALRFADAEAAWDLVCGNRGWDLRAVPSRGLGSPCLPSGKLT